MSKGTFEIKVGLAEMLKGGGHNGCDKPGAS